MADASADSDAVGVARAHERGPAALVVERGAEKGGGEALRVVDLDVRVSQELSDRNVGDVGLHHVEDLLGAPRDGLDREPGIDHKECVVAIRGDVRRRLEQ